MSHLPVERGGFSRDAHISYNYITIKLNSQYYNKYFVSVALFAVRVFDFLGVKYSLQEV